MYFLKVKQRGHALQFRQMTVQAEINSLNSVTVFTYCIANMWTEGQEEHSGVILGVLRHLWGSLSSLLRKKKTWLSVSTVCLGLFSRSVWITIDIMDEGPSA